MLRLIKPQSLVSTLVKAAVSGLLALSALGMTQAAEAPPISLVVPFPPGGSTDIASRIIQPKLAEALGRNVIIENKPGAATQIASQYVARAKPDGNTLLVSFDSHSLNPIVLLAALRHVQGFSRDYLCLALSAGHWGIHPCRG